MSYEPATHPVNVLPDLPGASYLTLLAWIHNTMRPANYFEVGTFTGLSLQLSQCTSIAVDPGFCFYSLEDVHSLLRKPLGLYQMTSDAFFAQSNPTAMLFAPIDLAFLDGLHLCEALLRDFINTERHSAKRSVILLHDCLPVEIPMTSREQCAEAPVAAHRVGWWTGDVWRTALALKRRRPDLVIIGLDAAPTGLIVITNLDPVSTVLMDDYDGIVTEMMSWSLSEIGLINYFAEIDIRSVDGLLGKGADDPAMEPLRGFSGLLAGLPASSMTAPKGTQTAERVNDFETAGISI